MRLRGATVMLALLLAVGVARADDSLARVVPADIGMFVELRQADDLLAQLVEPQLWLTLAELAGQPASLKETEEWRRRVEHTLNMPPADAIHALFSRRVAFVAEGPRNTQDAVVLCRPAGDKRELIRRWPARPVPATGRAAIYRLPNNVSLAVHDDLFIFGDQISHGLFERMVAYIENPAEPALADDADYRRLLAGVPADPDGVFFTRLNRPVPATTPTTSRAPRPPLPDLPPLLRGSSNVLLALHRANPLLHISVLGDAPGSSPPHDGALANLVTGLPKQTLLAWAGHVDYPGLAQLVTTLPERSMLRVAYQLQEKAGTIQRLTAALASPTCVALGSVMPENRLLPAPPVPALAVLVVTRDPQAALSEWTDMTRTTLALYRLLSLKLATPPPVPPIGSLTLAGTETQQLDLSQLLSENPEETLLGELHVSWALDHDVLIIASHSDWLRQILEARHGVAPQLLTVLDRSQRPALEQAETFVVGQTAALGDFGDFWLRFCEKFAPNILTESWWRNYQPGGGNIRLGLQVTADPERPRLLVRSITPDAPTEGILRPGDEIVGCNQRRFTTSQPVQEIQHGMATRPHARWIDLLVERDRMVRVRRIALPFVDPVEIARRVGAIGRLVQRVVYTEDAPNAAGSRGYLTLELRTDPRPQFDFPPPPVSQPTTTSTSAPATAPTQ
jgi:hypothetical protein